MSTRPHSLNDEVEVITKIRRDQQKKITGIVSANAQFPTVALGLVRDYVKNCSAHRVVKYVSLDSTADDHGINKHLQLAGNPTPQQFITVHTEHTKYHFRIKPDPVIVPPTLTSK
jgi:hypothetical protein